MEIQSNPKIIPLAPGQGYSRASQATLNNTGK